MGPMGLPSPKRKKALRRALQYSCTVSLALSTLIMVYDSLISGPLLLTDRSLARKGEREGVCENRDMRAREWDEMRCGPQVHPRESTQYVMFNTNNWHVYASHPHLAHNPKACFPATICNVQYKQLTCTAMRLSSPSRTQPQSLFSPHNM